MDGNKWNIQEKKWRIKQIIKKQQEIVILVGPEGGFVPEEFTLMRSLENLYSLNLGPRILRADTACIASLALVQEFLGDFW